MFIRTLIVLPLLLLLAGCAGVATQRHRSERQAEYLAATGAPVGNFTFTSLYSWEPLTGTQLVVYTRPTQAWLLDLYGCQNLLFSNSIALTSNINQVSANFDKVLTLRGDVPCTISRIRPVDVQGMRAAAAEKRLIRSAPRQGASDGSAH